MGVRGLWKVLEPTARPVSFEVLRGKTLAIDASIWIYHFVKAMRDPSGAILRAAHIVGFFRRLCKLLFYEIKPVFIFDGQAPTVKKLTTARRQHRREGREFNARATANKLLTLQIQRAQQLGKEGNLQKKRKEPKVVGSIPENANYLGQDATVPKKFTAQDQYHLPDLDAIVPAGMEDHRLLSQDELDEYAAKFTVQARKGFLLSDDIDFESQEFKELPNESKYQLLNMARMKSRLRMGYSTSELKEMFPDVLEFSRFQIKRVAQRNYFAQRLMTMSEEEDQTYKRISSEKNREYMLSQTGGGWTLSLGDRDVQRDPTIFKNQDLGKGDAIKLKEEPVKEEPLEEKSLEPESTVDNVKTAEPTFLSDEESSDDVFEDVSIDGEAPQIQRPSQIHKPQIHEPKRDSEFSNQMSALFAGLDESDEEEAKVEEKPAAEQPPWFENRKEALKEPEGVQEEENEEDEFEMYHKMRARPGLEFYLQQARNKQTEETAGVKKRKVDTEPESEKADQALSKTELGQKAQPVMEPVPDSRSSQKAELPHFEREQEQNADHHARETSQSILFTDLSEEDIPKSPEASAHKKPDAAIPQAITTTSRERSQSVQTHANSDDSGSILLQELDNREIQDKQPESLSESPKVQEAEPKSVLFQDLVESEEDDLPTQAKSEIAPESIDLTSPPKIYESADQLENISVDSPKSPVLESNTSEVPTNASSPEAIELSENELELAENEALQSENEEDDLNAQMLIEVDEHARFTKNLAENARRKFDEQQFTRERDRLRKQYASEIRDADGVTEEMVRDCQDLLQLFGIPYITAPTEAEAQCATLQELGLVDGVVTDDGDCFLFGKVTVYRNMFNQAKFVESYDSKLIEQNLGLDREKLIELALLLGSDYTDGIVGIGPVLGTEILAEFGDLKEFKRWWEIAQRAVEQESTTPLKKRLLKQHASKIFLKPEFPDKVVINAYLHPTVESDDSPFSWANPDPKELCSFMEAHAGWAADTTNQLIEPVLQESKRRDLLKKSGQTQASLDDYYNTTKALNLGSKRANAAAKRLTSKKQSKN